jgi:hypothetical protein
LQFEPVAGTVSGSSLQTPETPRAILTSAPDCSEHHQAAGAVAPAMDARGWGGFGAAQKVKVMREVVIVALAGFLIGIIVAAVLVHFLSWDLDDRTPLPAAVVSLDIAAAFVRKTT